ncbi:MAG TPA: DUF6491 family protein [Caulobacteraceae bacterium]|nr:DUF6491 family protein [Caulobacteraceae bacterium]
MPQTIAKTRVRLAALAAIAASVVLSAPVVRAQPAGQSSNSQCFWRRDIYGFMAPDDRTVYLRVGVSAIYRLDLLVDCTSLTHRQGIGLESIPGSDRQIYSPVQATIVYDDVGIRNRCPVRAIHKLTPAEVAALPKRDLP